MLGDYVDRGPDSLGTLRRLIGLERSLGVPVHILCGNHDQYLIEFLLADAARTAKPWRPGAATAAPRP